MKNPIQNSVQTTIQIIIHPDVAQQLKIATGEKTGSKAFLEAAIRYSFHKRRIADLEHCLVEESKRVMFLEQRIQAVDSACRSVLEITGQKDLLSN
ncbi:MAG: hypothetical protein V7739_17805 [Motiliproteus sp.]